jgi:hypothetical protein
MRKTLRYLLAAAISAAIALAVALPAFAGPDAFPI